MSLLQTLPYQEYQKALLFTEEQCTIIAQLANLRISYENVRKPGNALLNDLHKRGCSLEDYRTLLMKSQNVRPITVHFKPSDKVAILIANDKYEKLSPLATPSVDCETLSAYLSNMGFITIVIKNTNSQQLKDIFKEIVSAIPENSYCFLFYAGHGCELYKTKCLLSVDCPTENVDLKHCVTENFLLKEIAECKPDTCVLIMDMCRLDLNRKANPQIYLEIMNEESYTIHNNLIIVYTTQSSEAAYEVLEIFTSSEIDTDVTYEIGIGDSNRIVPGASQYVKALCESLEDNLDINTMLDKVHGNVENSKRKQRPIKVQCGVAKRSLYDPIQGDSATVSNRLREICKNHGNCIVR